MHLWLGWWELRCSATAGQNWQNNGEKRNERQKTSANVLFISDLILYGFLQFWSARSWDETGNSPFPPSKFSIDPNSKRTCWSVPLSVLMFKGQDSSRLYVLYVRNGALSAARHKTLYTIAVLHLSPVFSQHHLLIIIGDHTHLLTCPISKLDKYPYALILWWPFCPSLTCYSYRFSNL